MRIYEFTLILRADLEESARTELLEKIETWTPFVQDEGAPEKTISHWGIRDLAYPIEKMDKGYYVYYEGAMDHTELPELERNLRFSTDVLRYLIVRQEE